MLQASDKLRGFIQNLQQADSDTLAALLRQCGDAKALPEAKLLHAHIARAGEDRSTFLGNLLVQMYGKCGELEDARAVFDNIRKRNVFSWTIMISAFAQNGHLQDARGTLEDMPQEDTVSWNAMIAAYAQNGHERDALQLFTRMDLEGLRPDRISFLSVVDACARLSALAEGKAIHVEIRETEYESEVSVATALVDMYGKCGSLEDAKRTFDAMPERNVVSWTAMLGAYAQNGYLQEARDVFDKMPQRNVVSWTAMVAAYAQTGHLQDARRLFVKMPEKNVGSWNAMITGYTQNGHGKEALAMFILMDLEGFEPDRITFLCVIDACSMVSAAREGKAIHAETVYGGFQADSPIATALVNLYGRCGNLQTAKGTFDKMPEWNLVAWTAMVTAYALNGHANEALESFHEMAIQGVKPNDITFISVLSACSHAGLLDNGWKYFVSMVGDYEIARLMSHYRSMTDLLARAGRLYEAEELMKNMPFVSDVAAWKTLLGASVVHGDKERGSSAAEHVVELVGSSTSAPYVLLSQIYAGT